MDWRYWASFVAFSILLHVALFWPLPAPPVNVGNTRPLVVSLTEVRPVDLPSEPEPIALEYRHPEQESGPVKIPKSGVQSKISASKSAGLKTKELLPRESSDEPLGVESKASKLEIANNVVAIKAPQEDLNPSISRYRLALAAEVIRARASIERLVAPAFKGRLVVLVQLRGPNAAPLVSLDETVGLERLDREVLAAFRKATETVPASIAGEVGEVSIRMPVHFDQAALD